MTTALLVKATFYRLTNNVAVSCFYSVLSYCYGIICKILFYWLLT